MEESIIQKIIFDFEKQISKIQHMPDYTEREIDKTKASLIKKHMKRLRDASNGLKKTENDHIRNKLEIEIETSNKALQEILAEIEQELKQ